MTILFFLKKLRCVESESHAKILPVILSSLYQAEIVEEDAVLSWYEMSSGPVRDSAKPFVDWLNEAEEDEEDDE